MKFKKESFNLSGTGRLAASVAIALTVMQSAHAQIAPSGDTTVKEVRGVPVVNIVAPNEKGLSHNQYNRYNVGKEGAVLNNSTRNANSQLAGRVNANSHLNGRAADVILNEVISTNPSLLLGKQEVLGMAADVVLANPNGITCTGCGFINTPNASLVVGKPNIANGSIQDYDSGDKDKVLTLRQSVNADGSLNLVAPIVDSNAKVQASNAIAIQAVDASVVGAMQAGRIKIHAQDVKIAGQTHTKNTSSTDKTRLNQGKWWELAHNRTTASKTEHQTYQASTLQASQDIDIRADNKATINAQLKASNIAIEGGEVALNSTTTKTAKWNTVREDKGTWYNQTDKASVNRQVHGSSLNASNNIDIRANKKDLSMQAAQLNAGTNANIAAAGNLHIQGAAAENQTHFKNSYKNETAKLKTGSKTVQSTQSTHHQSRIASGGNVNIQAGNNLQVTGSQITAENSLGVTAKTASIGADAVKNSRLNDENYKYWGGIGGGYTQAKTMQQTEQKGSRLQGADTRVVADADVNIVGSSIAGKGNVHVQSNNADVHVKHAVSNTRWDGSTRNGTAFNITNWSNNWNTTDENVAGSKLNSASGSTTVAAGKAVRVQGSSVTAANALHVSAQNVHTSTAQAKHEKTTQNYTLGFKGYARQDGKALQGIAGARLQGVTKTKVEGKAATTATTLQGRNVNVKGNNSVTLAGTQLKATAGNANINAKDVTLTADNKKTAWDADRTVINGGGIYVSGGVKKIALGFEAGTEQTHITNQTTEALQTTVRATGNTTLNASNKLHNKGADVQAQKALTLQAKQVVNEAAGNVSVNHRIDAKGGVTLEAYAKPSPVVGASITLAGEGKGVRTTKTTAVATQLAAQGIAVQGNDVQDAGTQYHAQNNVRIAADNYTGKAAHNSEVAVTNTGSAAASLDVYTGDFQNVTAQLALRGAGQYEQAGKAKAVMGNIKGNNVAITAEDSINSAMNIQAKNAVDIRAAEDIIIAQANDKQWKKQYGAKGSVSGGATVNVSSGAVAPSVALGAAGNYLKFDAHQGKGATITADNVNVQANQAALVEGAHIKADNNVHVRGKTVTYDAAKGKHDLFGIKLGGSASVKLSISGKGGVKGGGFGIAGDVANANEHHTSEVGGSIQAGNQVTLNATDSANTALKVVGADITAKTVDIRNEKGDVQLVAATKQMNKGNWGLTGNLGLSGIKKKGGVGGFSVGGSLDIDIDKSRYLKAGTVKADTVNLQAGKDLGLQTSVKADNLNANVGGNVAISSAQSQTNIFQLGTGVKVGGKTKVAILKPGASAKDFWKTIHGDLTKGTILGFTANGRFKFLVDHQKNTQVSTVDAKNFNMNVGGGNVQVDAATVQAQTGTGFNGAKVTTSNNKDFVHTVGVDVYAGIPNVLKIITDAVNGKKIKSPIGASGQLKWEDKTVDANVSMK